LGTLRKQTQQQELLYRIETCIYTFLAMMAVNNL
jgi:hypothetical protein